MIAVSADWFRMARRLLTLRNALPVDSPKIRIMIAIAISVPYLEVVKSATRPNDERGLIGGTATATFG
jgi:hypothetical protein